jgi:hypothetical protein
MKKVVSITTDGGANIRCAGELLELPRVYCFNHLVNLALKDMLEGEAASGLLEKCSDVLAGII